MLETLTVARKINDPLLVCRWAGKSLSQKILHTELDHSDFMILVGVSDSSTYGGKGEPSWVAPLTWQVCIVLILFPSVGLEMT